MGLYIDSESPTIAPFTSTRNDSDAVVRLPLRSLLQRTPAVCMWRSPWVSVTTKNKSLVLPEPTRAKPSGLAHHPRLSAAQSLKDPVLAIFYKAAHRWYGIYRLDGPVQLVYLRFARARHAPLSHLVVKERRLARTLVPGPRTNHNRFANVAAGRGGIQYTPLTAPKSPAPSRVRLTFCATHAMYVRALGLLLPRQALCSATHSVAIVCNFFVKEKIFAYRNLQPLGCSRLP